jgi:2-dehydropantoate 2-reductase
MILHQKLQPIQVCIYGAGAIGGSLAVRLARAGVAVCVLARGEHGRAIARNGLTLVSGGQRIQMQVPCIESPDQVRDQDVVFVTVKGPSLAGLATGLAHMVKPHGRIVFAMNGLPWWFCNELPQAVPLALGDVLDKDHQLANALDLKQVIACVVNSSNEVTEPGVIYNSTPQRNRMILGKPDGASDPQLDAIVQMFRDAGYDALATPNIRQEIWLKMLLSVTASPISALTGADLDTLARDDQGLALMAQVMREAAAIGRTLGFEMPDDFEQRLAFYRSVPTRPSMLQDFNSGRAPEIDNGILAVDLIARALGAQAPALHTLCTLVRIKAQTQVLAPR